MSPVVQESLKVLEQSVFVLVDEAHHRVPVDTARRRSVISCQVKRAS